MIEIDVNKVSDIIRKVGEDIVLPRFKNLAEDEVRQKNPGDFVTIADEESEKALGKALQEFLPNSLVVGEEAVSKDLSVLDKFNEEQPIWVIDPIDGTYNFAHGRSKFGILVALVQNGETQYGWVYDAPNDRMAIAIKGQGATINGEKVMVRKHVQDPKDMVGMGGGGQPWHFEPVNGQIKEIINVRSSLHDFLNYAAGEVDFVVHLQKVTPWDHSPTILLVEEAGAYVRLAGEQIPFKPNMLKSCVMIAAADEARWKKLEDIFYPALYIKSA